MTPVKCKSIAEAVRHANDMGIAYRVFVNGECVKKDNKRLISKGYYLIGGLL